MKIVKTTETHAILNDDDEVVLPTDIADIQEAYLADPKIVEALMVALAEDVKAMLPVVDLFPKDALTESPGTSAAIARGVSAAMAIRSVFMALSTIPRSE